MCHVCHTAKLGLCWWVLQYQSCFTMYLTKGMSAFLLIAVFGDQVLHRAKLTFSQLPSGRGCTWAQPYVHEFLCQQRKNQNLIKTCWGALVSSASLSSLVPWDNHVISLLLQDVEGVFDCISAAQVPCAGKVTASKKRNFLPPSPTENYLMLKNINCLLFSWLLLGSY